MAKPYHIDVVVAVPDGYADKAKQLSRRVDNLDPWSMATSTFCQERTKIACELLMLAHAHG